MFCRIFSKGTTYMTCNKKYVFSIICKKFIIGYAGDVHFDLAEKFSLTEEDSTNFIWVTTHEFGHSLGLRHSPEVEAIMYPWYTTGEMGDVKLSKDDKNGIRKMYGTFKLIDPQF